MATGTFLDNLSDWNAKSAVVIKDLALAGEFETASLLMSLRSVANDETLSNEVRLNALTALINRAELLDVALPPYYPLSFTYPSVERYVGLHNDLSGLNTGNYWHLTYQEYLDVLNKPSFSDFTFANLTGDPYDNGNLEADLNSKEDLIASGSNGQFFAWDKTMRFVDWANLSNKPTTLAGLGISVGDTLFNSKYLQTSSVLTSYVVGANQIVNNTDTLIGAIGKLQGQINSITTGGGSISIVGITTPNTDIFSIGNSPLTGAGGYINIALQSQLAKRFFASPTSSTGTPTFREIVAADLPTSGISAGTYGNTTNWPLITVDAYGRVTNVTLQAATSGGTVTSVGLSVPFEFNRSGSPVTTAGTLGFSWVNQTAKYVLIGPVSGAAAAPSFRALVATDIPTIEISQVNTLQATLDALSDSSLGVLATDAIYIGNGSDAAVASVVSGDLAGAYLNDAGTNRAVFTIQGQAVTFSKFQSITSGKLLGRYTATTGSMQEISLDPLAFTLNASTGVLGLATPNPALLTAPGDLLTSDGTTQVKLSVGANATFLIADSAQTRGIKWAALSGDATIAVSGALTIAAGAVTLGKMANANAFSIIGNDTASTSSAPKYLTKTEATTLINTFDATADLPGLVPNGSGNDVGKFLSGAGTWETLSAPPGTTTNPVTFDVSGGDSPGTAFDGSAAVTVDYSTVGAPSVSGSGATGTWPIAISGNAATVTNGVYTSSTYNDPSWIGSLAGSKITGNISGSAGSVANSLFIGSGLSGSTFNGSANVTISLNMASANTFTALQTFEGQIAVGDTGAAGNIKLFGGSSGFVSLQAPASPDSTTYTLPSTVGSAGQYLKLSTTGGTLVWDSPGGITGTATQYAVLIGGAGNTIASLGAGTTTGQLLQYNSGSNNPSWTSVVYPASTTQDRILFSSSNNVIGQIVAPSNNTFLQYASGSYAWTAAVTSLTLSTGIGGVVSNSGTATAPVLSVSGTLGGLVYFDSATSWDSTGTLDQGELIVGGGTSAPSTINNGAAGTLLKSNGGANNPSFTSATYPSTTQANRILFSSSNDVVDQIAAPTTASTFLQWNGSSFTWAAAGGGGGSGTVGSGSVGQLAVYTAGTTVNGFPSTNSIIYGDASGAVANLGFSSAVQNLYLRVNSTGTGLVWDTAGGSGSGTVNNGQQFGVAYYPNTGTAVDDITPPSTNGGWFFYSNVTANAPVLPEWLGSTGSGNVVRATSAVMTTPNIGAATAASINGLTITASTGTLTIANGSTLATLGAFSTTLTATGATNVTLPTTGTLATLAGIETLSNKTILEPKIGDTAGTGHAHFRKAAGSSPAGITNYATLFFQEQAGNKRMSVIFDTDAFQSELLFAATTSTKTYTFPNVSGTVALIDSTQTLTIPASGGTSGDIALGVPGGSSTVSLVAPATLTGAGIYTLPNAYPTGASQYLTATTGGVMSWVTITGGGNVVGPASSTTGNFAVYADTTGLLLANPSVATLSATGRATFNDGVDVGVSSSTTGTLVFRNSSNAFTTTLQQSTSSTGNATYTWPLAAGTAGQILSTDNSGNLSWTNAGAGNVTTSGIGQVITGSIFFLSNIQVRDSGQTRNITLAAPTTGGTGSATITFPVLTGTVALLDNAQTFAGAKTFTGGVTVNAGTLALSGASITGATFTNAVNINAAGSTTVGSLTFGGGTNNWINFGTAGAAAPSATTRSAGTKIVLSNTLVSGSSYDCAIGFNTNTMWFTAGTASGLYEWYGAARYMLLDMGTRTLTLGTSSSAANQDGKLRLFGSGQFAGSTTIQSGVTANSGSTDTWVFPAVAGATANVLSVNVNQTISANHTIAAGSIFTVGQSGGSSGIVAQSSFRIQSGGQFAGYAEIRCAYGTSTVNHIFDLPYPSSTSSTYTIAALQAAQTFTATQKFSGALSVIEGTNQSMGLATLAAGTVTVSTTRVGANSRIYLTVQTAGGTQGNLRISARTAGTSFTITSTNATETSTVAWLIIDPS